MAKVETNPASYMPTIFDAKGEEMPLEELRNGDILVVHWTESAKAKYKTEISVVYFEASGESMLAGRDVIYFHRAESVLFGTDRYTPGMSCHPLKDISEIRFCARDSSASARVFSTLASLYEEKRRLWDRLKRIENRLRDLAA